MLLLDALLRYSTVTLLLMFASLVYRDGSKDQTSILGCLTAISVAALLMGTPHPELALPHLLHVAVRFLDVPSVVLVWWFACGLFDDSFRIGKLEWAVMTFFLVTVGYFRLHELNLTGTELGVLPLIVSGCSIALMLHVIWVSLKGRDDDMIEPRRQFRLIFALGMVLITITTVVAERVFWQSHTLALNTFRAGIILPFIIAALHWVVSYRPESLSFNNVKLVVKESSIDPRDEELYSRLIKEVEDDKAYREHGLTITSLAEKLNAPEHRLRALINQGMKFRNFSSFINHYRISAVQSAMAEPENARVPILTLALKEGYNSLAPFNRAFKSVTGSTPSEFKQSILDEKSI